MIERALSGLEYLRCVTQLLQRARLLHPSRGVWEAADLQWWWRRPRATDESGQLFWFDRDDNPVAAVVTTDWGGRCGLDIMTLPSLDTESVRRVWRRGLAEVAHSDDLAVEVMVDDEDVHAAAMLESSGFSALPGKGRSAWMPMADKPPISALVGAYRLLSRPDLAESPHHFAARNGPDVEARLRQTSLYRPELDLIIVGENGTPVSDGLFWYDPTTQVGFVEPMGTDETYRGRGLARHILTSGIDRLIAAGATRIKINYEADNAASSGLYLDSGFLPSMTTSLYVRKP